MAFDVMEDAQWRGRAEPPKDTVTLHLLFTGGQTKELLMNKRTNVMKTQYRWGIPCPTCFRVFWI